MTSSDEDLTGVEWLDADRGPDTSSTLELLDARDRSLSLRIAGTVVLIGALVAAGIAYVSRSKSHEAVTFAGDTVTNATTLVAQADALFTAFVRASSGAVSANSRCYFDRVGGKAKSDVQEDLYCGPVLFFQGRAPSMYLRYGISPSEPADSGQVILTVALDPELDTPGVLPTGSHLERPDGKTPPTGADGLVAPGPPAAPADAIVRVAEADVPGMTEAPESATMTGLSASVKLVASGYRQYFGRRSDSRSAAVGHRLFAFELQFGDGEMWSVGSGPAFPSMHLLVDGGAARMVPLILNQDPNANNLPEFIVASVPTSLRTLDLVIDDSGTSQSLSLLTGTPAPSNVAVLQRSPQDRYVEINKGGFVDARVISNGSTTQGTYPVQLDNAHLGYFVAGDTRHASGRDRALLTVLVCSTARPLTDERSDQGSCIQLGPSLLSLTPTGGKAISANVYGIDYYAFDVPATFTSGTLTVRGTLHLSHGSTVTITKPWSFTITLP